MNRRHFAQLAGAAAAAAALQQEANALPQQTGPVITDAEVDRSMKAAMTPGRKRQIAMLLYPGMYPLDLVGPHTFLSGLMNVDVHLVWKSSKR